MSKKTITTVSTIEDTIKHAPTPKMKAALEHLRDLKNGVKR